MIVNQNEIFRFCDNGRCGYRYSGSVEGENATIAMFILQRFDNANHIDLNIVAGSWGNEGDTRIGKVSFFATLYLDPDPGFVFNDPTPEQQVTFSNLSEITMSRNQVLASPDLPLIRDILDAIFASGIGLNNTKC